jgi:hypothetical protein
MHQINAKARALIEELKSSEKLFDKATSLLTNADLKDHLKNISGTNSNLLAEMNSFINEQNGKDNSSSEIAPNLSEEQLEHLTQWDLVQLCIRKEEMIVTLYQKALSTFKLDNKDDSFLREHLNKALIDLNQLKMIKESVHYQHG